MQFTITRQNLHQALTAVAATIPARTTLPVLSNVLIEAEEEGIRVSGTDLDVGVRVGVPATVSEPGSTTAPGKKLQQIARELPDEPVEVHCVRDEFSMACGRSHFRLNALPASDFPALPQIPFEGGWHAPGGDLLSLIRHASYAVSTEESRPVLNGVLWELRDREMRMVATNGHRLVRMTIPAGPSVEITTQLVVPPVAFGHVQRIFGPEDEIRVAKAGNQLGFASPSAEVYTRLIEGTFPNYEQVIPKDNEHVAVIDRSALASAIRRVAALASAETGRVRLGFEPDRLEVHVVTPDLGEARDEIEVGYGGPPMTIGFNARYILEVLRYIDSEELRMSFKDPERAAVLEPIGTEEAPAPDYLCLVMPLRTVR